jgi:hypothetical protein
MEIDWTTADIQNDKTNTILDRKEQIFHCNSVIYYDYG